MNLLLDPLKQKWFSESVKRYNEINDLLSGIKYNSKEFISLSKEHSELHPRYLIISRIEHLNDELDLYKSITNRTKCEEREFDQVSKLLKIALEEANNIFDSYHSSKITRLKKESFLLEVKAGTGGSESNHFNSDLVNMYLKLSEKMHWHAEIISCDSNGNGEWFSEMTIKLTGKGIQNLLQFESGVHRVQRVPVTETQGRVHTSTSTVSLIPTEAANVEVCEELNINTDDLKITTFRSSGAGGQHVNKTDSAVRIVHIPTGIKAECQNNRSQGKNKEMALTTLKDRIRFVLKQNAIKKLQDLKKEHFKTSERSEKHRTYNFLQKRITDHKTGMSFYNFHEILNGGLDKMIEKIKEVNL
jgi:peptide chain release factor 1